MRILSFKILVLCILIPPVLYIASAYFLERHFQKQFASEIEDIYTGDPGPLFQGSLRLKDAVNKNINRYLKGSTIISMGLNATVTVTTQKGSLLYPAVFSQDDTSGKPLDPLRVAAENFALMNDGLVIRVDTKFEHNRLLSNGILACYVMLSTAILFAHHRRAVKRVHLEDQRKRQKIDHLQKMEQENANRLEVLEAERGNLTRHVESLKSVLADQKKKADRNEDDLIEEIEELENKLSENYDRQVSQMEEIAQLRETIQEYEKSRSKDARQKTKAVEAVKKRFNTLYKNISVHERAISGYVELNEELRIKAEEIIHQLNADAGLVSIKRKVFGGKTQKTVLEVIFAYKGRLYFRNTKAKGIEVLAIGTKNTQARDFEFLARF
jgi:hypothetical protein